MDGTEVRHLVVEGSPESAQLADRRLASVTSVTLVRPAVDAVAPLLSEMRAAFPQLARIEVQLAEVADGLDLDAGLAWVRAAKNLELTVAFVLDAEADTFEAFQKRPTSLAPIFETAKTLRTRGVMIRFVVPLIAPLVFRLEGLFSLAQDERIDPRLAPAWALPGWDFDGTLDEDAQLFVRDFLKYRLLDEEVDAYPPKRTAYHQFLLGVLDGVGPRRPAGARPVAHLSASGLEVGNLPTVEDEHDLQIDEGPAEREQLIAQVKDVGGVLLDGQRALGVWSRVRLAAERAAAPLADGTQMESITLIGAYGGEHIGDAAILGGVLLRAHEKFGTKRGVLMTQRPDHTQRLVRLLDTPVELRVELYEHDRIEAAVAETDGVVYAGGPLMDLPKQLVRHLYAVSLAKKQGKPIVLEGIGAGPFERKPSEWVGRQITLAANRISIRTAADQECSILDGLTPELGHDPAFDYLASRGQELSRLPDVDREWVERLVADREDKKIVGLNLRPIRPLFTTGVPPEQRDSYTRFVERRFEERLAEAMKIFSKSRKKKVRYVYYPMNAIQFGSSDLKSAYRLARHLRSDVDFRVWEGDATLDGVVALLRRIDAAIAMRFHANIFALSQGCAVVGIDYRPGKRDKVDALLRDRGLYDNVARIDAMTVDWLVDALERTL
ncbi:MAG: polysaccharide pyruvyl transferase family protein [Deltaproteobacteria bacterium]